MLGWTNTDTVSCANINWFCLTVSVDRVQLLVDQRR